MWDASPSADIRLPTFTRVFIGRWNAGKRFQPCISRPSVWSLDAAPAWVAPAVRLGGRFRDVAGRS
jgi:hypothetical protein